MYCQVIHLRIIYLVLYNPRRMICPKNTTNNHFPLLAGAVEYRGVRPTTNKCPSYDTKQSNGEAPAKLELWGMRSTPLLSSLPGSLSPGVVAPERGLSIGQIELNCVLMLNWTAWNRFWDLNFVLMLNWIAWNKIVLTFKLRTYAKLNCMK